MSDQEIKASNDATLTATNVADATANAANESTETQETNDDGVLVNVNTRLLNDARKWKKRAMDAEAEKKRLEEKTLTSQGEYKVLYEKAVAEKAQLESAIKDGEKRRALERAAAEAGCIDLDGFISLGDQSLLVYDDETKTYDGIDAYRDDLRKRKSYLFQQKSGAQINPAKPGGVGNLTNKPLKDLSKEEIMARLRALG